MLISSGLHYPCLSFEQGSLILHYKSVRYKNRLVRYNFIICFPLPLTSCSRQHSSDRYTAMKLFRLFLQACTLYSVALSARHFDESITAQQLLGSHFGVPGISATYDYVILGGGTAGLTLARRLAADSNHTVAVVNAGDFAEFANGNYSQIPAYASVFGGSNPVLKNPLLDWEQYTTRQSVRATNSLQTKDHSRQEIILTVRCFKSN